MGIGRRDFLKFVAAALGGLAVDPIRTIAVNGDYYVNARLGLGFIKPSEWAFDAFQDFAPNLEGQILHCLQPDDADEFRRDQASTLVATIVKRIDSVPRFSPAITVFKNQEDYEIIQSKSLEEIALDGVEVWKRLVKNCEVLESPSQCQVSRCHSIRFKCRWVFEHREIQPILIEDETLLIDQGSVAYTIHLYDSPSTGDATPKEFARFKESLRIA
jgi:hypothetical protein